MIILNKQGFCNIYQVQVISKGITGQMLTYMSTSEDKEDENKIQPNELPMSFIRGEYFNEHI